MTWLLSCLLAACELGEPTVHEMRRESRPVILPAEPKPKRPRWRYIDGERVPFDHHPDDHEWDDFDHHPDECE